MATLVVSIIGKRKLSKESRISEVCCSYCERRWGPWEPVAIQPCPWCLRPLYLTAMLNRFARKDQVSGLLDTVDAVQGIGVSIMLLVLAFHGLEPRTVGLTIAMAMFVAATAHACDGVLALKTGVIRSLGRLRTGRRMKVWAWGKIAAGIAALVLSFTGILIFTR
jgi:hypothetical protein